MWAQGEGVGRSAAGGDAVEVAGLEVRGGVEAADPGGPGGGRGGGIAGAAAAGLEQAVVAGRRAHAGGGGQHRAVVVEDREAEGLEDDGRGEVGLDGEDGAAGEVDVALAVAVDVAVEGPAGEVVDRLGRDDAMRRRPLELVGVEAEVIERVEQPGRAADRAVTATVGERAAEDLEHRPVASDAGAERRVDHGELVVVGAQRRRPADLIDAFQRAHGGLRAAGSAGSGQGDAYFWSL